MFDSNMVHVAYALDDNYLMYTCISITSLLDNTTREVCLHVLESRLSQGSKDILQRVVLKNSRAKVHFHHICDDEGFPVDESGGSYLTPETYYRVLLPEYLPNIDKLIWLDGDTLIEGDIGELYDCDLDGFPIGAVVQDFSVNEHEHELELEFGTYFNAGVLLLDLNKLRTFDLSRKVRNVAPVLYSRYKSTGLSFFADQDCLNYLFKSNYKRLPPKYNFVMAGYSVEREIYSIEDYAESMRNPAIVHAGGKHYACLCNRNNRMTYKFNALTEKVEKYIEALEVPMFSSRQKRTVAEYLRLREQTKKFLSPFDAILLYREDFYIETAKKTSLINPKKLAIWGSRNDTVTRMLVITLKSYGVNVDLLVDGMVQNQGSLVFGIPIQSPEVLLNSNERYFVLLTMQTDTTVKKIETSLMQNKYSADDYYHVYNSAYV